MITRFRTWLAEKVAWIALHIDPTPDPVIIDCPDCDWVCIGFTPDVAEHEYQEHQIEHLEERIDGDCW